jgi:hypothetical protein
VYEKLKDVISENKELEKMVSAGRVEQLGMEIGLLRRDNEGLREVIEGTPGYGNDTDNENIRERCLRWTRT